MSSRAIETTPTAEPKLRIWPAVIIVALQWLVIKGPPLLFPDDAMMKFMGLFWGPIIGAVLFIIWWLFFSRVWAIDRWLVLAACITIGAASFALYHPSLGMFGMVMYALPVATTAWLLWLLITPMLRWPARVAGLIAVLIVAFGYFTSLRFDGVYGDFESTISYRWVPTDEKLFLVERSKKPAQANVPAVVDAAALTLGAGDWPAFRGANRDARLAGVTIDTNWSANPPKKLWSHRVGPGWSSVTVIGNRLFTQEQRDKDEVVVCYDADTGAEIWTHIDDARFEEPVAGAGPRATPTFHEGRLFTMGAAGKLNCLDAATGKVIWVRNVLEDAGATNQMWGLAASPLVHQGIVTVYAPCPRKDTSGVEDNPEEKAVLGYREANGELAWSAGKGAHCYSSAQLNKLNGVEQVLFLSDAGLYSLEPASGKVLWRYDWPTSTDQAARIVQPAVVGESDVLVGTPFEKGTRRVHVDYDGDKWSTKDVWESETFKPYFNDFVVHDGHLYGFNGNFFTCLSLADGSVKWKERGYGSGQALLLADQNLLVVLTEKGEVALLETNPGKRTELARIPALEGKTWNHPVIAHGKLFVRNGAEMACFQLSPK